MKFSHDEFTAIAFIFEEANGTKHSDFEREVVAKSGLRKYNTDTLQNFIIEGLDIVSYEDEESRTSAYWTLNKLREKRLISSFRKWLSQEVSSESFTAIFQILIALDALGEKIFKIDSRDVREQMVNLDLAKSYLLSTKN